MPKSPSIPFLTGQEVCRLARDFYSDSPLFRVNSHQFSKLKDHLPTARFWIDAGVDGIHEHESRAQNEDEGWVKAMNALPGFDQLATGAFHASPDYSLVEPFVAAALNGCASHQPAFVTVPQLPYVKDNSRNKVNRMMAKAAYMWRRKHPKIKLILPIILTHRELTEGKVVRNPKVTLASQCLDTSQAEAYWVVDCSFSDEEGSPNLRRDRMQQLIAFHQELNERTQGQQLTRIAGPYWALNLVLWTRGLVDNIGTGVGTGYKYYLSGGFQRSGDARVAIEPLLRRARVVPTFTSWVAATLKSLDESHPFHKPLSKLQRSLAILTDSSAKRQVAKFQREWTDQLLSNPEPGRPMALFQSLSMAFSYGKQILGDLKDEGATRRPESIAEPLMLNCF
jgi:hypothetical protein